MYRHHALTCFNMCAWCRCQSTEPLLNFTLFLGGFICGLTVVVSAVVSAARAWCSLLPRRCISVGADFAFVCLSTFQACLIPCTPRTCSASRRDRTHGVSNCKGGQRHRRVRLSRARWCAATFLWLGVHTHSVSHAHCSGTFSLRGVLSSRTRTAQGVCSAHVVSFHSTFSLVMFHPPSLLFPHGHFDTSFQSAPSLPNCSRSESAGQAHFRTSGEEFVATWPIPRTLHGAEVDGVDFFGPCTQVQGWRQLLDSWSHN